MILMILTALLTSVNLGLIGPIILWRRISTFGDGISHALILAGSLSLFINMPITLLTIIIAIFFSLFSIYLSTNKNDKNLSINILSSLFVAISIFINDFSDNNADMENILFGDILSVDKTEFLLLIGAFLITGIFIIRSLKYITITIFSPELSFINNINYKKIKIATNIIIAINIAISIKITGVLLMSAMLLIPSAIAREISIRPIFMIIYSVMIAFTSMLLSVIISYNIDQSPASISVIILSIFYICMIFRNKIKSNEEIL